jgi:two-component system chemotaxis response regulator CheY
VSNDIRILLVDDFDMVRIMLKNSLADLGYNQVEEAENGRVALAMLKDAHAAGKPYSIVFCDWNMPEVTGIEVLESCRSMGQFKELPFVMVTAEAEQAFVVRAIRAGATDYLVKPIAPDVLEKKINKLVSKVSVKSA